MFRVAIQYQGQQGIVKRSRAMTASTFRGHTEGWALKFVYSGQETYRIGTKVLAVNSGEFLLLPAGLRYEASAHPQSGEETTGVCIDLPDISLPQLPSSLYLHQVFRAQDTQLGTALLDDKLDPKEVLSACEEKLVHFAGELREMDCRLQVSSKKGITRASLIDRLLFARSFLSRNYQEPFSLQKLSRIVGISPFHLTRSFRLVFQETPLSMLHRFRMERGKALMSNEEVSLTEIAHQLGYNDLPSFSKKFSRHFGYSPSAWRLQN